MGANRCAWATRYVVPRPCHRNPKTRAGHQDVHEKSEFPGESLTTTTYVATYTTWSNVKHRPIFLSMLTFCARHRIPSVLFHHMSGRSTTCVKDLDFLNMPPSDKFPRAAAAHPGAQEGSGFLKFLGNSTILKCLGLSIQYNSTQHLVFAVICLLRGYLFHLRNGLCTSTMSRKLA